MPKHGSRPSPAKSSGDVLAIAAASLLLVASAPIGAQEMRFFEIVDDGIPEPLTGTRGDPARGRAIVVDRQKGLCLLCHSGPFPEQRFQGNLAPDLSGVGARWSEGQLRLRIVDSRRINPATIMPPYHSIDGLVRVGKTWQGKPVLSAEQVEDVVAFLTTLTEAP
ncbi:sulfur oxidation c-type cytochrome SoxX [Microvirga sp. GCM10011540]|uniref:sulfur oxidation c-type cytochrome SoxX n=1 Tax=Microvirga sp. GCM10011540 TaxID=3317338 RepID=UPI00361126B8